MEDPQRSVIGEEEHHEKKSMMKKVKDRAVKIKDTLKKRGYGRDHVNEEENVEHEEEEEDDDDDGVQDPEAHGAAEKEILVDLKIIIVFESTPAHTLEGQGGHPGRSGVHLGNTQPLQEDSNKSGASEALPANYEAKTTDPSSTVFESTTAHTLEGQGGHPGGSGVHSGNPQPHQEDSNKLGASEASPTNYEAKTTEPSFTGGGEAHLSPITHSFQEMQISEEPKRITAQTLEGQGGEEAHVSPVNRSFQEMMISEEPEKTNAQTLEGEGGHLGRSGVHSDNPQPLQENPNQPGAGVDSPTNYQAKTMDPSFTGAEEAHVSPVNRSFQEMMVSEEPEKTNAQTEGEGGHLGRSGVHSDNPQPPQENPNQPGAGVDSPVNYQAKTTDPSFTGEAEAHVSPNSSQETKVSEEPEKTEDSPRGIHDEFSPTTPPSEPTPTQAKPKPTPNHPQSYTEKITSTATAISGKATSAASTVYEAVTGKTTQGLGEKGVSMREYLVGKLSPGEEDKTLRQGEIHHEDTEGRRPQESGN
ncbi:hypothetical protein QJS10_CPB21g00502 [Acorus calamus]|uniref:Low-temperature-induced 65 kDa protein n=1 Tax=Acorus calamus TaxID=4465 RepID=A0AAV9C4E3_ACOCL|nr:hypothetical protein QJS10_CPB21g00502 [Acorus calamus]